MCYYIAFGRLRILEFHAFVKRLFEFIFTSFVESALDKSALEKGFWVAMLTKRIAMDRTKNGYFIL
jgi:hypothetical protein